MSVHSRQNQSFTGQHTHLKATSSRRITQDRKIKASFGQTFKQLIRPMKFNINRYCRILTLA
jgi:hypothetical protein